MRGTDRARVVAVASGHPARPLARLVCAIVGLALAGSSLVACGPPPERVSLGSGSGSGSGSSSGFKSSASLRAARRAYDGAPPVAPHEDFRIDCISCHSMTGMEVPEVGFAPPSPHATTLGMSAVSRCRQCHVFAATDTVFVASTFQGLAQDLRHGRRLHPLAPPVMPHKRFMREHCAACHAGPAAREEIRTSHPERVRCGQCHVEQRTDRDFLGSLPPASNQAP